MPRDDADEEEMAAFVRGDWPTEAEGAWGDGVYGFGRHHHGNKPSLDFISLGHGIPISAHAEARFRASPRRIHHPHLIHSPLSSAYLKNFAKQFKPVNFILSTHLHPLKAYECNGNTHLAMKPSFSSPSLTRGVGVPIRNARFCPSRALTTPSRCHSTCSRLRLMPARLRSRLESPAEMAGMRHYSCGCARRSADRKRTAYVALGSNLGDRVAEIERACNEMDKRGIRVKRTSSLWETEPMYVKDQNRFVNGACEVETELEPLALLDQLQAIERDMGREKIIDKGPRNIDLDILLYDNEKIDHERLKVPHASIVEREFVLRPLAELIPAKPLDPSQPWKLIQDYLNDLPRGEPLSSMTPLSSASEPLTPLRSSRKTHIMGILNLTPDSFSDGGLHDPENLASTILSMVRSGASIIDIGGQSTAPGRPQVSADEETSRIISAVQLIRSLPEARDIVISIDTYRASVAEQAVASGADLINDVRRSA
ncbi:hypothetical protein G7046_g10114 [Stylonectria norvegica]|nr:hypothetical protein G7046_g10114 [Stylonectria norvegica]